MEEVYRLSGGWSVLLIQTPFTLFSLMIYDNRIRTFSLYSGYPETIMSEMPELSRTLQVNCISISCWMLVMWAVTREAKYNILLTVLYSNAVWLFGCAIHLTVIISPICGKWEPIAIGRIHLAAGMCISYKFK